MERGFAEGLEEMKEKHPCEFYIDGYTEVKAKYDRLVKRINDRIAEWQKRIDELVDMPPYYSATGVEITMLKQKQEELKSLLEEEKK